MIMTIAPRKSGYTIVLDDRPGARLPTAALRRSGAGRHDNRPKRLRTRNAQKRAALRD
jgi:hypothetical protein